MRLILFLISSLILSISVSAVEVIQPVTANKIGYLNSGDFLYSGRYMDIYQFQVLSEKKYSVFLASKEIDSYLHLINLDTWWEDGSWWENNNSGGNENSFISKDLKAGTYWVGVTSYQKQTGKYNLNICDLPKYRVDTIPGYDKVYAIAVYLCAGAKVVPVVDRTEVHQKEKSWGGCNGINGTYPYHTYTPKNVHEFAESNSDGLVAISGSYHGYGNNKGNLSFPVTAQGHILTYGSDPCAYTMTGNYPLRMLRINESQRRAIVENFSMESFEQSSNHDDIYSIVVGYHPEATNRPNEEIGRNFVCAKNPYNGGYGTLVFLVAADPSLDGTGLTRSKAVNIMKDNYKCSEDQIIQFDSSTVAQLSHRQSVNKSWYHEISGNRRMAQAFIIK